MRELQALVAPKPPQGVLVRGHAGLVINKLSLSGMQLNTMWQSVITGAKLLRNCLDNSTFTGRQLWTASSNKGLSGVQLSKGLHLDSLTLSHTLSHSLTLSHTLSHSLTLSHTLCAAEQGPAPRLRA